VKVLVTLFKIDGNVVVVRATKSFHVRKYFKGVEECSVMRAKGQFYGLFFSDSSLKRISETHALNFPDGTASVSGDWFNILDYSQDGNISEKLSMLAAKLAEFSEPTSVVIGEERQIIVSTVQLSKDGYVEFLKLLRISLNE